MSANTNRNMFLVLFVLHILFDFPEVFSTTAQFGRQKLRHVTSNVTSCITDSDCDKSMTCMESVCRCPPHTYYDPVLGCLPECHMTITATSGYIASPRSGSSYRNATLCTWTIRARVNSLITFTILSMDLKVSPFCAKDYLELFDGLSSSDRSLGRQCEKPYTTNSVSSSRFLFVVFRQLQQVSKFTARFSTYECNTTVTDKTGIITSPGWPLRYFPHLYCTWDIVVDPGMYIVLSLTNISMEQSDMCLYDKLEIFGLHENDGRLLGVYCGRTVSNLVWLFNSMRVVFQSDQMIDLTNISMEQSDMCLYDKLEIFGLHENDGRLLGVYCGRTVSNLVWLFNSMRVVFQSDQMIEYEGFIGNYTAYECNMTIVQNFGYVTSPGYPRHYMNNLKCSTTIVGPIGTIISLSFNEHTMENCPECNCDVLEIFDGASSTASVLARSCGTPLDTVRSTQNIIQVSFQTNGYGVNKGFNATFAVFGLQNGANCMNTNQCKVGICHYGVCTCTKDQFYHLIRGVCISKLSKGCLCNTTEQCLEGLFCIEGRCDCKENQVYNNNSILCEHKSFHGEPCVEELKNICASQLQVCRLDLNETFRCLCEENYIFYANFCVAESELKVSKVFVTSKSTEHIDIVWLPVGALPKVTYNLTWSEVSSENNMSWLTTSNISVRLSGLIAGKEYLVKIYTILEYNIYYKEKIIFVNYTMETIPDVPGKLNKTSSSLTRVPYVLQFEAINGSADHYEITLTEDVQSQTYSIIDPVVYINPPKLNVYYGYYIVAVNKLGEKGKPLTGVIHITSTGVSSQTSDLDRPWDWKLIFTIGLASVCFMMLMALIGSAIMLRKQWGVIKHTSHKSQRSLANSSVDLKKLKSTTPVELLGGDSQQHYDKLSMAREHCETNLYTIPADYEAFRTYQNSNQIDL